MGFCAYRGEFDALKDFIRMRTEKDKGRIYWLYRGDKVFSTYTQEPYRHPVFIKQALTP
ncbi:MAG: hypothetical protein ACWA5T_09270 [Parvularcula sp.]